MKFTKKQFYKASSTAQILIVVAILVAINILSIFFNVRWDMTQGNDFSISKTTKVIIKNLDDVVTIKAYFTKDLPGRLIPLRQQVEDILDEYVNYSRGNINVSFIDPAGSTELEQEVRSLGIPSVQFSTIEQDKYELANGYLGIAILYEDSKEVIPVVQNTITLEYELTNAIKKVMSEGKLVIAFATGHAELSQDTDFVNAVQYLAKQYEVIETDLSSGQLVPDNIKTLIIAQPKETFSERSLYVIDQFLMRGGSILALIDGTKVEVPLQASVLSTGLENLLSSYGIRVNQDLVLDVSNDMASFSSGFVQFFTPYPFFVKAVGQFMNPESVLVNRLESVTLPWVSSIDIIGQAEEGTSLFALVRSTDKAWSQSSSFNLDPQQQFVIPNESRSQFILAAAKFGKFQSFFLGRDIPAGDSEQSEEVINETLAGRLIVVGDADFAVDGFLRRNSENLIFFSNLVDGLTQDLDLIMIRSKSVTDRPLKELSYAVSQVVKYLNILVPTLIVVIYGFIRFYIRRKESRQDVI